MSSSINVDGDFEMIRKMVLGRDLHVPLTGFVSSLLTQDYVFLYR